LAKRDFVPNREELGENHALLKKKEGSGVWENWAKMADRRTRFSPRAVRLRVKKVKLVFVDGEGKLRQSHKQRLGKNFLPPAERVLKKDEWHPFERKGRPGAKTFAF